MHVRMCRSADNRGIWLAVCFVGASAATGAQSGSTTVGAVRQQAWPPGVLTEVQRVIREGVPVGLVLGLSDRPEAPPPSGSSPPDVAEPVGPAALDTFRQRWAASYTITQTNDVVMVTSPRMRLCRAGLARAIPPQTFSGAPLEILFGIASTFDDSLRKLPPPGIVHGGGAARTEEANDSITRAITLRLEAGSLEQALNRLVTSAPGLGWLAWERCGVTGECGCYLSLVTETSVLWTSYNASAGLPSPSRERAR